MPQQKRIKYFMSSRAQKARPAWRESYAELKYGGTKVYDQPEECAISVVLGGCLENPLPLRGTKVMALKVEEWKMLNWDEVYEPILVEYYDHIIDTTGLGPTDTIKLIEKKCKDL